MNSDKFSSADLTELASSIGTVQLHSGSLKQARKSFDDSMKRPNENSFPQVEFASDAIEITRHNELIITFKNFRMPLKQKHINPILLGIG